MIYKVHRISTYYTKLTPKQMKQELSFDLLLNTGLKKPLIL